MLLFLDGQAHYDTSRIGLKYTSVTTIDCTWAITAEGRFGNCIKRVSTGTTGGSGYLAIAPLTTRLGLWTPTTGGVCGFALKVDDLAKARFVTPDNTHLLEIYEGAAQHIWLELNPDGTFSLYRNDLSTATTLLAQSTEALSSATWMYVEFKWVIHATTGSFAARVNGVTVLTFSGNTRTNDAANLGVWNTVRLLGVQSVASPAPLLTLRMCDLYLADLATSTADDVSDFLGDGIIETIMPNGVGASSGWTPTGAAANWDATNDRPAPDDDTTYVRATAIGTTDLYQFEDIPTSSLVKGIHVNLLARKEDVGSSSIRPLLRQGSTDYAATTQGVASTAYDRYVTQAWDLNPATNAKFTAAEINAGQFGVEKMV